MANKPLDAPPDGFEDAPPDGFEPIITNDKPVTRTALAFAPGENSFAQSPVIEAARREGPTSVTMTIPQTTAVAETDAPITHIIKAGVDPHQEIASGALKPGDVFYQQGVGKFKVGAPASVTRNLDQTASDMPDAPPDGFTSGKPEGSDAWGNTPVVQGKPFLETKAGELLVTKPEAFAAKAGEKMTEALRSGTLASGKGQSSAEREQAIFDEAQKTGQVPYGKIFGEMAAYVPAKLLSGFVQSWMTPKGVAVNLLTPKIVGAIAEEVPALQAPLTELWHDYVTGRKITKTVTVSQLSDFFRSAADSGKLSPDQMTQMGDAISNLTKTASGVDVTARVPRFGEGAPEIRSVTPSGEPLPEPIPASRQLNAPVPAEMPRPTPGPDLSSLPPEIRALVQDRGAPIPKETEAQFFGPPIAPPAETAYPMGYGNPPGLRPPDTLAPGPVQAPPGNGAEPGSFPLGPTQSPQNPADLAPTAGGAVGGSFPVGTVAPGPSEQPLPANPPRKVRQPTRREVESYAEGLYRDALASWKNNQSDLEKFIMDNGGVKGAPDIRGEFKDDVSIHLRGRAKAQKSVDEMADMARAQGVSGSRGDILTAIANMKGRGPAPTRGMFMDTARHELEHEYEVYGPPKKSRVTGDVEPAPFEKGPVYGANAPTFYSQLQKTIEEKVPNSAPVDQVRNILKGGAIKQDEIDWSGIDDFLKDKTKISKTELLDFLRGNEVKVHEVVKGGVPKFSPNMKAYLDEKQFTPASPEEWNQLAEKFERIGRRWQENGDDAQANKFFEMARESDHKAEGLNPETGSTSGEPKFASYQLPGGENYREMLLTLPRKGLDGLPEGYSVQPNEIKSPTVKKFVVIGPDGHRYGSGDTEAEALDRYFSHHADAAGGKSFKSSHFDEPNILAHVRMNDRTTADGKKMLFLEEVQSDWHQKGRTEGYQGLDAKEQERWKELDHIASQERELTPSEQKEYDALDSRYSTGPAKRPGAVSDAPFKKTWHELALKRMLRYAVDNGYDSIGWTTGEQQADRYDLSKQLSEVSYSGTNLKAFDKSGHEVISRTGVAPHDLPDLIGKDAAQKLMEQEPKGTLRTISGVDLKVGGEGMKGFYDKILPDFVNKYTKKWGGKSGTSEIMTQPERAPEDFTVQHRRMYPDATDEQISSAYERNQKPEKVHSVDITPSMQDSVKQGQSMFEKQPGLFGGSEPVTGKPAKPGAPGQISLFGQKAQPKFEPPASAFKPESAPVGQEAAQPELVTVTTPPGPQAQRLALTGEGKEQVHLQVPRPLLESVVVKDLAENGFLPVHKMRIESPTDTAAIFNFLKNKTVENFYTLALDAQDKIVGAQLVSVGTIDQTVAAPMDALRGAHLLGAKKVVFVHNHPSLRADPSREDMALTKVLDAAAKSIGIEVKHHVVIDGDTEYGLIGPETNFAPQTLPLDRAGATEPVRPGTQEGGGATTTPRNAGKPVSVPRGTSGPSGLSVPLVEPLRVGSAIGTPITNPETAVAYVKTIRDLPKGVVLLGLDTRGQPVSAWFMGSHYQKPEVMAADIGKIAMRNNSAQVILAGDRLPEKGYVETLQKVMRTSFRIDIRDVVAQGSGGYPESAHINGWIVKDESPVYEGVKENGDLALPPLKYVDDKALSFQPLDITSKKGLKATGADIRTEYAGSVNAQKAVVAHLAQDIKKLVPSLVERQGLTIGRDAGWDENVLRDALQSDKPQLVAARPAIKAALNPTPAMLKAGELMTKYYGETGLVGRTHGFLSSLVDDERYINRIYKQEPPNTAPKNEAGRSGLSRSTSHAKARFYETILDAMKGGKIPATLDAADLLTIHGAEFARTLNNNKLYEALARENVGYKMKNADEKIPSDWTRLGNSNFVVPKWFEVGIRAITDPNFMNRVEGMKGAQAYQGLVKTIDLSLSAFHHFTMVMQLLYQNKYGLGIPSLAHFMKNADYRKVELDFLRHGGTTHTIDANMEVLRKLADGNDWMSRFLKMPGMKQYIGLIDANNKFLFGKMQPWFKVMDYGKKVAAWAQSHPKATEAQSVAARRSLAKEVNATYGGLNWKALGVTPTGLSIGRLLFLAPDWTYSNIELLKTAASKGPGGAAARGHILSALIGGLILTEGLNHILTGHSSGKNAKGHQFEIEVRPGVYVSLFRGAIGDALKWANMMHENGLIVGSARFVQGKTAPLVRTGLGLMSNTNYIGRQIVKKRGTMMSKTGDALKFIAGSAGPVPFGASAIAQAGSMDPISDILILSGLARPGRPGQTEQPAGPQHIKRGPKK